MTPTMPIGEVIASRELNFVDRTGKSQSVQINLGKPIQEVDGPWFCPYQISAQGFNRQFRIAGEDAMQAILLAVKAVTVELEVLATNHEGSFTWFGESDLGLWPSQK